MKYIFDFDDVLFNNTKQFKEHMYTTLVEAGISRSTAEAYYGDVREKEFSLRDYLNELFKLEPDKEKKVEEMYQKIIRECPNFVNTELLERVKRIGINNCYIVTTGDDEFQWDKIKRSGIASLFHQNKIRVVPESKREAITKIIDDNPGEEVVFIDDKVGGFEKLADLPNLTMIHYKENVTDLMKRMENKNPVPELKRRK